MKILYCHGLASGPLSSKGRAVRDHLAKTQAKHALAVDLLDLRVPSPTDLRLSRMIDVVRDACGERTLAIGSSLGGLTVARAAERDARIVGAVLLAPAFRLVERWRARLGEQDWARWQRDGTFAYDDHTTPGGKLDVEFSFMVDAERTDVGWPEPKVPTTIVHGRRDETVDPELSRTFAKTRPNVRLVEVEDDHQLLRSLDVIHAEIDAMLERLDA
jgi:pimeloyl-ACP methyl ester carboxylesterase